MNDADTASLMTTAAKVTASNARNSGLDTHCLWPGHVHCQAKPRAAGVFYTIEGHDTRLRSGQATSDMIQMLAPPRPAPRMLPGAGTGLRVFIRLTITSANSAVARHSVEQIAWAAYQQIAAATTAHFVRQTVAVTNTDIAPILTRPPILPTPSQSNSPMTPATTCTTSWQTSAKTASATTSQTSPGTVHPSDSPHLSLSPSLHVLS